MKVAEIKGDINIFINIVVNKSGSKYLLLALAIAIFRIS